MRRATRRFLRQLKPKQIFEENGLNKFRLPWWGGLYISAGTLIFALLFNWLGHFELTRPVMLSIVTIGCAVAFRWQLRHHLWFWGVIAVAVALHALAIAYQSWTTRWIPAAVSAGYVTVDLYVVLMVISIIRKFEGDESDSETPSVPLRTDRASSDHQRRPSS